MRQKLLDGDPIHLGTVPTVTDAAGDDELVRQALNGLFEIASDERPASVQANLREQIAELPARECRHLVEQMVDTNRLADLVEDPPETTEPADSPERVEKVDRALGPLVRLELGEKGHRELADMQDGERMHVLFSSLGGAEPPCA